MKSRFIPFDATAMRSFHHRLRMEFTPAEIAGEIAGFYSCAALWAVMLTGWAIVLKGGI